MFSGQGWVVPSNKIIQVRRECVVCQKQTAMTTVFNWKKIPITGLYCKHSDPMDKTGAFNENNDLLLCEACGQLQLLNVIDPDFLYGKDYVYRSSVSQYSRAGIDFFDRFVQSMFGGHRFKRVLEVGCNDLYWLTKMKDKADRLLG